MLRGVISKDGFVRGGDRDPLTLQRDVLWLRELDGEQVERRKLDPSTHDVAALALQRLRASPQLAQLPDAALVRALRCSLQTLRYSPAWAPFREMRDEVRRQPGPSASTIAKGVGLRRTFSGTR